MSKARPESNSLTFEEPEQEDALMEKIFNGVKEVPDKEPNLDLVPKNTPRKQSKNPADFQTRPDDELDLHGKTREEAIMMVQNFVKTCHVNQFRTALIITGKGYRSGKRGPVLNQEVRNWLKKNGKPYLKDFQNAPPHLGGSGAFWLIFK